MARKILVEVSREELDILNKGITKEDIIRELSIDELFDELRKRTDPHKINEVTNINPINDVFERCITGSITTARGFYEYKKIERE